VESTVNTNFQTNQILQYYEKPMKNASKKFRGKHMMGPLRPHDDLGRMCGGLMKPSWASWAMCVADGRAVT